MSIGARYFDDLFSHLPDFVRFLFDKSEYFISELRFRIKKKDWLFDWSSEAKIKDKTVYKLVIVNNPGIIQGLISLQDRGDHIFMHLIESNKFNRGARKIYLGVPGNLVAFACKLSFDKGYEGYVSFESKTKLINHYSQTLGAELLFGNIMAIDTSAAAKLIDQYYPKNFYL